MTAPLASRIAETVSDTLRVVPSLHRRRVSRWSKRLPVSTRTSISRSSSCRSGRAGVLAVGDVADRGGGEQASSVSMLEG